MDKKRLLIFPILFGVVLAAKLIAPHYSAQPIPGLGLLYTIVTLAISFFYCSYPIIKRRKKMMIDDVDTEGDSKALKNDLIEKYGGMSISTLLIGILYLAMHWPGAKLMLYVGMFGCMAVAILCAKQWGTNINARYHLFLFFVYISFALIANYVSSIDPPKINVSQNISGTWYAYKKLSYILEQDSLYQEVSSEDKGEWLNIFYIFNPDGTYFVDYNQVGCEGRYEIKDDSLKMSDIDSFPCHNALVTIRSLSNMKMATHSLDEDSNEVKTEIHFDKLR